MTGTRFLIVRFLNYTLADCVHLQRLAVDCVLKETWRWGVPVPLGKLLLLIIVRHEADQSDQGLPHCLTVDDVYCGMHIPKGTIVSLGRTPF